MKSVLRFSSALALAALVGCSQNQQPVSPETNDAAQTLAAEELSFEKSLPKITVPDDYATIQAAVDAASGAMKINVKSGTYTEAVVVTKPGLVIGATGTVTLNGGFYLTDAADHVTIRNFNITPQGTALPSSWPFGGNEFAGIYAGGVTGGKAEDNTVTGGSSFELGIYYENSTGVTIKDNKVSGTDFGIVLKNSSGNTIDENTATGVIDNPGIGLEENCDNNKITGNLCTGNLGGIFTNAIAGATCDNNVFKDNKCNNNTGHGIDLIHGNNNTVSGNTANGNTGYGILVRDNSNNNTVKKNKAFGNTPCDITNDAGNTGNVFIKNSAGCTSGF
ncbi:right-handed parallel beta-helix repeat-containing protein [candidate division KSB1 bacterium]|nr:right-handed parallel beta-helix repeat-containing protein [candidate division KSB1 bacterium]